MNFIRRIYYDLTLSGLEKRQLRYLADRFEEWHRKNCPELSVDGALAKYPGIPVQELLNAVR